MAEPLSKKVADELMQSIFSGEIHPGQVLKEKELADAAEVSQATVREAFTKVSCLGLITQRTPNHSHSVALLTKAKENELQEVFLQLMDLAYACDFDRSDLPTILEALETLDQVQGTNNQRLAAFQLHCSIWRAQRKDVLLEMMRQASACLFAFSCNLVASADAHTGLVQALVEGNQAEVHGFVLNIFEDEPAGLYAVNSGKEPAA